MRYITPDLSYGVVNIHVFITKHALKHKASILHAVHVRSMCQNDWSAGWMRSFLVQQLQRPTCVSNHCYISKNNLCDVPNEYVRFPNMTSANILSVVSGLDRQQAGCQAPLAPRKDAFCPRDKHSLPVTIVYISPEKYLFDTMKNPSLGSSDLIERGCFPGDIILGRVSI